MVVNVSNNKAICHYHVNGQQCVGRLVWVCFRVVLVAQKYKPLFFTCFYFISFIQL